MSFTISVRGPIISRRHATPVTTTAEPGGETTPPGLLRQIFRQAKWRLLVTYSLFNIENLLRMAQPWVLGWAINDLLNRSYHGLLALVIQHLSHLCIATLRQRFDTRVFTHIYTELATDLVQQQRLEQVDVSRIVARSALSREFVEFFERYVPLVVKASYSVAGALVMLAWYDWVLVPVCLVLLIPCGLFNGIYGRRALRFNRRLHDELEREVDVILQGSGADVREHYTQLARCRIRLSDAEAFNFAAIEFFVLGVMVVALIRFCTSPTVAPGDIFAVFRYVLLFILGLDNAPTLVHQWSRLRDIGRRLMVVD